MDDQGKAIGDGLYKYVRFADGKVLLGLAWVVTHKFLADLKTDAPPFAAGTIKVRDGRWCMESGGSTTLKLPQRASDEKFISAELGAGFRHDPELWYGL